MTHHAAGSFEVKMTPRKVDEDGAENAIGRISLEKQFQGGLAGTSRGEMLSVMTETKGSAGYVAVEYVSGVLDGRSGSFALQHSGTMRRGEPTLAIAVVPDSGTGDLAGVNGTMTIAVVDGRHSYDFAYSLPEQR